MLGERADYIGFRRSARQSVANAPIYEPMADSRKPVGRRSRRALEYGNAAGAFKKCRWRLPGKGKRFGRDEVRVFQSVATPERGMAGCVSDD